MTAPSRPDSARRFFALILVPLTLSLGLLTGAAPGRASVPGSQAAVLPPSNDNFANSIQLVGAAPLTSQGSNVGATKEAGEPEIIPGDAGGHSIWYTWTPVTSGTYVVNTRGSNFDTLLGIYTGTTVASLTPVATNDDDPTGGLTSGISLTASRGVTYQIVVDGSDGEVGNVVLNIVNTGVLYATAFEASEGFDVGQPLVGQNGWLALTGAAGSAIAQSPGGSGLIDGAIPDEGLQAFVGRTPPTNGGNTAAVYHPIKYPLSGGQFPVVNFSTLVQLTASTNGQSDQFGFSPSHSVVGVTGQATEVPYFTLLFDEATGTISYQLDDGTTVDTGYPFDNGVTCTLTMSLDFVNNVWSATLEGVTIVEDAPLSALYEDFSFYAPYQPVTLTSITADWVLADATQPGDNFMAFDNYAINTPEGLTPAILVQPTDVTATSGATVSFSVTASGTPTLLYQWYFNGVPIDSEAARQPTYTVGSVNSQNAGSYSVTVTNLYGTVQSLSGFLVISTIQPVNTAVVQNNALVPQVTASSGQEGSVLFTRTGDTTGALTVSYTVHGTAQSGVDYVALSGTANIKAGRNRKRVKVIPIDTGIRDGSSVKVVIKVVGLNGYTVGGDSPKQRVFIIRD